MTLTEFILARIAEDEAPARAAAENQGANWQDEGGVLSGDIEPVGAPGRYLHMYAPEGRWMLWDCEGAGSLCVAESTSAHIARHDPARVLADCAARRAIVEDYELLDADYRATRHPNTELRRFQALVSVARLAAVYDQHPEFDETWRP